MLFCRRLSITSNFQRAVCISVRHTYVGKWRGGRTALLIARNRRSFFRQTKRRMLPTPRGVAAKHRWSDHRFRAEPREKKGKITTIPGAFRVPKVLKYCTIIMPQLLGTWSFGWPYLKPRTHNYRSQTEKKTLVANGPFSGGRYGNSYGICLGTSWNIRITQLTMSTKLQWN